MPMDTFEKLGLFYLGRPFDLESGRGGPGYTLYDSKDLVTHAIAVGMTGSGKTGLCLGLLEEAAIDGIPAIAIDPKGDLANLLLTFPGLRPQDFLPWINPEDARAKNLSNEQYAAQQAEFWKKGLAEWGQDGSRIARLRNAAEFAIYTPGSMAGLPLCVLSSFDAPAAAVLNDVELLNEHIGVTVASLLTLVGVQADPNRSREHILLSTILGEAWRSGRNLDLPTLIQQIQTPPVTRVGVLELETFYPSRDRFELAMRLNNLLAAPGFQAWIAGDALDIGRLLYSPAGKPRVSIISIAHLNDAERMFSVSLILNQLVGWMRAQSGTASLRALLYMDEIAGYFPPVAMPPSKPPLLTLLKQARAFGLGVVLATQNPVDLDYKGLANIGTWFLGRLQTERDKLRVVEGLEGAGAASGSFDYGAMERTLAGLKSRVFLMRNTHESEPVLFETRWTLSYLRGPLTRDQIRTLMAPQAEGSAPAVKSGATAAGSPATTVGQVGGADAPPALPPDVSQHFLPIQGGAADAITFEPHLFVAASLRYTDAKRGVDVSRDIGVTAPLGDGAIPVKWEAAVLGALSIADLLRQPPCAGRYSPLPANASRRKSYEAWSKDFVRWASQEVSIDLFWSARAKQMSRIGESEGDFRVRLRQAVREQRDQDVDRLRQKWAARIAAQVERVRRSETAQARESQQATQQKVQTALSFGATILGALLGRKAVSASTLGRATTAARGVGRTMKESEDVSRAIQSVQAEQDKLASIEQELQSEIAAMEAGTGPGDALETITLRPRRTEVLVKAAVLAWKGNAG